MRHYKNKIVQLLGTLIFSSTSLFAATPVDLSRQPVQFLPSLSRTALAATKELKVATDAHHTKHERKQQLYKGYPVFGADYVVHTTTQGRTAAIKMNGIIFENLDPDLSLGPSHAALEGLARAIAHYEQKLGNKVRAKNAETKKIIFVDKENKAHWAYHVQFHVDSAQEGKLPAKPNYIIDANDLTIHKEWNNIQTRAKESTDGGGFGGNEKMGKITFDGLPLNHPKLNIFRNAKLSTCYLQNDDVVVEDASKNNKIVKFYCSKPNLLHNLVYWNGEEDAVNGAYSPANDALYAGLVIKEMYQQWYGIPVLVDPTEPPDGSTQKPMRLHMRVHDYGDNAYWDGFAMNFGDGESMFYPLTSLGVAAHEISHGFTEQHSNLIYDGESGGINESFSDMAAQAAEYHAYGKNSWQIGPEISKADGYALRYMDKPSRDGVSIDNADQYKDDLDVHYSSGVFNRAFYLIATSKGWNTKMAFDVMAHANRFYWTSNTTFDQAACDVLESTKDYGYPEEAVKAAFKATMRASWTCGPRTQGSSQA